ncbi:unnamed protein product [Cuscuta campestris]|uniref:CHCH domain-containing protein n=1 Tax=Cuscuta campestris TaxID=132261 RepID=A0A484MIK9_9ASTE|nr:unnamed protein product [Cuscuta campestris]
MIWIGVRVQAENARIARERANAQPYVLVVRRMAGADAEILFAQASPTQVKDGSPVSAPTSLTTSHGCWSHAKSLLACLDMQRDYKNCKSYFDTLRECLKTKET